MEGGFFMLQHVDLVHDGQRTTGIEITGHACHFGSDEQEDIQSRFYDNAGNTLESEWVWPGGGYRTVGVRRDV